MPDEKRLGLRYSQIEHDRLEALALQSGVSVNILVRLAIEELVSKYEKHMDAVVLSAAKLRTARN